MDIQFFGLKFNENFCGYVTLDFEEEENVLQEWTFNVMCDQG